MNNVHTNRLKQKRKGLQSKPPLYCDFTCKYASFPPKEIVGDCRKEIAVYCTLIKRNNNKNNKCLKDDL